MSGVAEVTVQTPDNGTFLRVDACYDGEEIVCENFAGSYTLSPDGSIRISPSAWDGSIARVTWIVIE